MNGKKLYKLIYGQFDGKYGDLVEKYVEVIQDRERYKKAYNILMEHWDSISDEEKTKTHKKLQKMGL